MEGDPELVQICEVLMTQEWSPRRATCSFYIDEARGLIVLTTVPLLDGERRALRRIGADRILVDESIDPNNPNSGRRTEGAGV